MDETPRPVQFASAPLFRVRELRAETNKEAARALLAALHAFARMVSTPRRHLLPFFSTSPPSLPATASATTITHSSSPSSWSLVGGRRARDHGARRGELLEDGAGGAASQPGARLRCPTPRRRRRATAFLLPVRAASPPSPSGSGCFFSLIPLARHLLLLPRLILIQDQEPACKSSRCCNFFRVATQLLQLRALAVFSNP